MDPALALDELAERLAEEMSAAWQRGERPCAEDFFARYPELRTRSEAAIRLIYEEICLRQDTGDLAPASAILQRFPQWRPQLELLLDGHERLQTEAVANFPAAGEVVGPFQLLAELARGAAGRVFLAAEPALGERRMVLKMTPCRGEEYLMLARLQHTHVVPLYGVLDVAERNLRVLCMPFLGGTTLDRLLPLLKLQPSGKRTGAMLTQTLDQLQSAPPPAWTDRSPARNFLARLTYVQAICWIGACLADALQYAHERGFLHLDLKPANVLLAADGQPMLLDFHLARAPIEAGQPAPAWLGGTPRYMSPEQTAAVEAVGAGGVIAASVDGRSDVYSLGLILYEALGGSILKTPRVPLHRFNRQASLGLSDIVRKCLAPKASDRYGAAGLLADDLRRHLNDLPLRGVRNRSLRELWTKWRRRRPHALFVIGTRLLFVLLAAALAVGGVRYWQHADEKARDAAQLRERVQRAERAQAAQQLHRLAERVRFIEVDQSALNASGQALAESCAAAWDKRPLLLDRSLGDLGSEIEQAIKDDLFDIAVFWCEARLRPANVGDSVRREVEQIRKEANALLQQEGSERTHRAAGEHYTAGRALLKEGKLKEAAEELDNAVRLRPQSFWAHFYRGICAARRAAPDEALRCFDICVALAPERAECYFNRALAHEALGESDEALSDLTEALKKDDTLATAYLNRGVLYYRRGDLEHAEADLLQAGRRRADPVVVDFNHALVYLAKGNRAAARKYVERVLTQAPDHPKARVLLERLQREP